MHRTRRWNSYQPRWRQNIAQPFINLMSSNDNMVPSYRCLSNSGCLSMARKKRPSWLLDYRLLVSVCFCVRSVHGLHKLVKPVYFRKDIYTEDCNKNFRYWSIFTSTYVGTRYNFDVIDIPGLKSLLTCVWVTENYNNPCNSTVLLDCIHRLKWS